MGKRDEGPFKVHTHIQIAAIIVAAFFILVLANIYLAQLDGHNLKAASNNAISNLVDESTRKTAPIQKSRSFNLFYVSPAAQIRLNAPVFTLFKPNTQKKAEPKAVIKPKAFAPIALSKLVAPQPIVQSLPTITTPAVTPKPVSDTSSTLLAPKKIEDIINAIPTYDIAKSDPRKAVVQILCKITEGNTIKNISSSGIIISDTGLILTNAHVAIHPFLDQYTNKPIICSILAGYPTSFSQTVSLIYISPEWTARHPGEIHGSLGQDTGEGDFAILKTSPPSTQSGLQKIPLRIPDHTLVFAGNTSGANSNINNIFTNQQIKIIAYPITGNSSALPQKEELLRIESIYGFSGGETELIETSVSSVGKSGASGGALIDDQKYLVGIVANIVSATQSGSMSQNTKVHGISLDHIDHKLRAQTGMSLYSILNTDGSSLKQYFENNYAGRVKGNLN